MLDLFEALSERGVRLRASSFNVLMEELAAVSKAVVRPFSRLSCALSSQITPPPPLASLASRRPSRAPPHSPPPQLPKWREVVKVRKLMQAYKVAPDTESYSWVITAYLAMSRVYDATRLLAEMGDEGAWRVCVCACGVAGLWGKERGIACVPAWRVFKSGCVPAYVRAFGRACVRGCGAVGERERDCGSSTPHPSVYVRSYPPRYISN